MDKLKFQNTVLYLLRRCAPNHPGVTSLLKMLYFADYDHYRQFLSPITGAKYVALERGPVVDDYKELFETMRAEGAVSLREVTILGTKDKKQEYLPEREPDPSMFTSTELEVLDAVASRHGSESGQALSEKTHLEGPWSLVWDWRSPGREIPYMLFRWIDNLPDPADLAEARAELLSRPAVMDRIKSLRSPSS